MCFTITGRGEFTRLAQISVIKSPNIEGIGFIKRKEEFKFELLIHKLNFHDNLLTWKWILKQVIREICIIIIPLKTL